MSNFVAIEKMLYGGLKEQQKPRLMKYLGKTLAIIIIIGIITVTAWYYLKVPPLKISPDKIIENYENESYVGVVLDKYIDQEQHGYHKIVLKEKDGQRIILLDDEISSVFNYIKKGDTLQKVSGSLKIHLKRQDVDTLLLMKF